MELDFAMLMTTIGVLVALVNIITEVLKKATWENLPTNILAVVVSQVLTICTSIAYCQKNEVEITWYLAVGMIVLGFMVAYAAMFGFDKLKQTLQRKE